MTRIAFLEQGPWAPRKIANPHYFRDDAPLGNLGRIGAAAVEIWTMDTGYFFDNVLVGSDPASAAAHRTSHWAPKLAAEVGLPGRIYVLFKTRLNLDHGRRVLFRQYAGASDSGRGCLQPCLYTAPAAGRPSWWLTG